MQIISPTKARIELYHLIDEVADSHEYVYIKGKRNTVVIMNLEDLKSMQETLYLYSIPGMVDSILEGANTPYSECIDFDDL